MPECLKATEKKSREKKSIKVKKCGWYISRCAHVKVLVVEDVANILMPENQNGGGG